LIVFYNNISESEPHVRFVLFTYLGYPGTIYSYRYNKPVVVVQEKERSSDDPVPCPRDGNRLFFLPPWSDMSK
jgi:hypothetical protein